jgi:hypothetical protein
VIVRIKAWPSQLGRFPGVEVEQLEPTVVGPCSSRCRSVPEVLARIDTSVGCSIKASFASLDVAACGFRVLCAKASLEPSERQTPRQSPAAGEALFGARVLCAFAYWQVREIGSYGASP